MIWQYTVWGYGALVNPPVEDKLITAISTVNSSEDKEKLLQNKEVKEAYDALTDVQKSFVENLDKLNNALSQILEKFEKELEVNDIKSTDEVVTGKAGANIEIYVDGILVGNGSVNEDGTFEAEIPALKEGKIVSVKMTKEGYETLEVTKTVLKGNNSTNPGDVDDDQDQYRDQDVYDDQDQNLGNDNQDQDGNQNNDNSDQNSSGYGSNVQTGDPSSVGYLVMGIMAIGVLFLSAIVILILGSMAYVTIRYPKAVLDISEKIKKALTNIYYDGIVIHVLNERQTPKIKYKKGVDMNF